ncbi:MAG: apolipoprotein N-acyltransferase [Actinomycetota bacterium]
MSRSSFLLVLAGLLVAASMPPWGWWPLGFLGIALYGSVAEGRREQSFSTGFLFAVAWFLPSMAWMWFLTAPGYIVAILIFCVMHGFASYIAATLSTTDHSHRTALIVCHSLAEVWRTPSHTCNWTGVRPACRTCFTHGCHWYYNRHVVHRVNASPLPCDVCRWLLCSSRKFVGQHAIYGTHLESFHCSRRRRTRNSRS